MSDSLNLRSEEPRDAVGVRSVHLAAFPTPAEADLVDALRAGGRATVSWVAAAQDGAILGHILFSPVTLDAGGWAHQGLGLAPLAVLPALQRQGVGLALLRASLEECRRLATPWVVLVGWPGYYCRVGFGPAASFGLRCAFSDGDAFQALELIPGSLPAGGGFVEYSSEFAAFE